MATVMRRRWPKSLMRRIPYSMVALSTASTQAGVPSSLGMRTMPTASSIACFRWR